MDRNTRRQSLSRTKPKRVAACAIILLTANIATFLVPRPVSAQPLNIEPQQVSED